LGHMYNHVGMYKRILSKGSVSYARGNCLCRLVVELSFGSKGLRIGGFDADVFFVVVQDEK
jgi:hypothetical protein